MTSDDLSKLVTPCSVDVVTMIFVLSAVSPDKMAVVLQNIRRVLKPNGYVLFRDYATGDLAQERFTCKDQKISENFYVRGDGTRAFYFSEEYLRNLFEENGFHTEELGLCCKQVENRSRELVMNRRWIQAVFRSSDAANGSNLKLPVENGVHDKEHGEDEVLKNASGELAGEVEVDMSDGVAQQMFGISFSEEVQDINFGTLNMKIRVLPKEYQHTCKSTGLMLWESARLMASILAENPTITSTKRVLELGSGSSGLCSIVAAHYAKLVVTTDGDIKALDLLTQNVASNTKQTTYSKVLVRKLEWGNEEEIGEIKELCEGFDVIIGTDVTYVGETILPLFMTAKRLISCSEGLDFPCFLLCHTLRRVDEPTIISTAARAGFILVDRWPSEGSVDASRSIVGSWVSRVSVIPSTALSILCFRRVEEFMSTSTGSNKGCWVKYDTDASFDWKEIRF